MTALEITGIHKSYGAHPVLRGLDLAVAAGSFTSILGPSGSGKTTLLRVIAGFERADRGVVRLGAEVVDSSDSYLTPDRRRIGFVPQEGSLFPHLSVEQNVGFGLQRRERRGKRVAELLEMVGLSGLERRYPHQLSGGQRQRVAIARALASKPSVLLLDEPFGAVDAKIREELREWLVTLHHDLNVTTLFVTHDQEEALEVSNRIVIFSRGILEQVGTPREVYEQPANEFVARFIGAMNVLELQVSQGAARAGELEFPAYGLAEGQKLRIGFRPYAVQISSDLTQYRYQAVLRHTFFLGVLLRVELELPSGLTVRARMTKEEYAHQALEQGKAVSFQIRQYRLLAKESAPLPPERELPYQPPPGIGENI